MAFAIGAIVLTQRSYDASDLRPNFAVYS
jgi:hypothetical protein